MDTSDPEISFDEFGNCNHCVAARKVLEEFEQIRKTNPKALDELIEEVLRNPGKEGFHAIIGVSGGVDSSYLLHILKDYPIKLLAVHVDAGWNSIEAVRNINSVVNKLDLELETKVIDWETMKQLQLAYLRSGVINQDVPQDHAFFGSLFLLARRYKIKYVFSGSNIATESILPRSWGQNATDGRQIKSIFSKYGKGSLRQYPLVFMRRLYFKTYISKTYQVLAPLNYMSYSKKVAVETLEQEYKWLNYGGKHQESRFTEYFQRVYLTKRFGIDKSKAHLSSQIVSGEITREEALRAVSQSSITEHDETLITHFIASKLGISARELSDFTSQVFKSDKEFKNESYLDRLLIFAFKTRSSISRIFSG
jgi:N-acetyl sugar amidotransferase